MLIIGDQDLQKLDVVYTLVALSSKMTSIKCNMCVNNSNDGRSRVLLRLIRTGILYLIQKDPMKKISLYRLVTIGAGGAKFLYIGR